MRPHCDIVTPSEGCSCASLDSVTVMHTGLVRYRVVTGSVVKVFDANQYDLNFSTVVTHVKRTAIVLFHHPGRHYNAVPIAALNMCLVENSLYNRCVICRAI